MIAPSYQANCGRGPTRWPVYLQGLVVLAFLLVVRGMAIYSVYFFEEDEISLAAGAAALVRDNVGDLYRYTPQLGYYRFVEYIDLLLGGNVALIPAVIKALSAFAGALIPVLGLVAFKNELTSRERWLATLALAINPIIWKSSQYGNTAIVATAFATGALVILSNKPFRAARIAALTLFGIASLVRADAVLLVPVMLFLLYQNGRSLGGTLKWGGAFGLVMVIMYGAIFAIDSRIDSATSSVMSHMVGAYQTQFWEYLLWAMSPVPLIFAISGMQRLLLSRAWLFSSLFLWCIPTMLFYFPATTTPRYFLNIALPLSIAGAVAMDEVASRLRVWLGSRLAWTGIIGLASAHLAVALQFDSVGLSRVFRGGIVTHDGKMPTGAFIPQTYLDPGVFAQSFLDPQFGKKANPYWEGVAFTKALETLADPAAARRTVIILLSGGWDHAFHYHAQVAGARYISRTPSDPSLPFATRTWLELGNARVMTVMTAKAKSYDYQALSQFDVVDGDQIWVRGKDPFPDSVALHKMPPGLTLVAAETFNEHFRVFHVVGAERVPR